MAVSPLRGGCGRQKVYLTLSVRETPSGSRAYIGLCRVCLMVPTMLRLVLTALAVAQVRATVCGPDVCLQVDCPPVSEETCVRGRIIKDTGFCGCCEACDHTLVNGHRCAVVVTTLEEVPIDFRCPDGWECDHVTLNCKEVEIGKRQDPLPTSCTEYRRQLSQAGRLPANVLPQCQEDGSYSPRQCGGSVCYCVDERGTVIEGYTSPIAESADMDCECARDQYMYAQSGLKGKQFSCADKGRYPQ